MSWIFGIQKNRADVACHDNIHGKAFHIISTSKLYIAFGGITETCLVQKISEESGWAVLGLGIQKKDQRFSFIDEHAWNALITGNDFNCRELDGHFIIIKWNNSKIEIYSDQLGLRTIYFCKYEDGICFSTRIDWIARATKNNQIDFDSLAERWLLFNQLSYKSCVKNISRLGPSGKAILINGDIKNYSFLNWSPDPGNSTPEEAMSLLDSLTNIPFASKLPVSLSLSGGIDSRTILSLILKNDRKLLETHTFGDPNDPDVKVAKSIVNDLNINHNYFQDPMPEKDILFGMIKEYAAQNILEEPVSAILKLRYYKNIYSKGEIILDGGFGELGRRQYLNRLKFLGAKAIYKSDIDNILPYLRYNKADIFISDFNIILEENVKNALAEKINEMPAVESCGLENFIDLFAVRSRVPNFGEAEQMRSDCEVQSFMPMVQPSFLNSVFNLNIRYRENGRLYREIIKKAAPSLTGYSLVKGGTTYPFPLSSITALMYVKIMNRVSKPFVDSASKTLLFYIKDYVYDLALKINEWPYYSKTKILGAIDSFYKGNDNQRLTVEWWLTFELWRQSLLE